MSTKWEKIESSITEYFKTGLITRYDFPKEKIEDLVIIPNFKTTWKINTKLTKIYHWDGYNENIEEDSEYIDFLDGHIFFGYQGMVILPSFRIMVNFEKMKMDFDPIDFKEAIKHLRAFSEDEPCSLPISENAIYLNSKENKELIQKSKQDVILALLRLGYSKIDSEKLFKEAINSKDLQKNSSSEMIVAFCLKNSTKLLAK
jgi:hypothetical protein